MFPAGVSEAKVEKMIDAARKLLPDAGFTTASAALIKASLRAKHELISPS